MPKPDLKKLQEDVKKIRERFLTMRRLLEELRNQLEEEPTCTCCCNEYREVEFSDEDDMSLRFVIKDDYLYIIPDVGYIYRIYAVRDNSTLKVLPKSDPEAQAIKKAMGW
jgi:hypothetical protein